MDILRLKEYREKFKMSQSEVANLFNITQQAYSRWEVGISFPSPKQILQLCKIFKCTPNELFGFKGVHTITSEEVF